MYNGIRYLLGIGVLPRSRMGLLVRGANCMPCHHYHGFIGVFQDSVPHMDGWHCIAFISLLSWPCCCPRLCGWVAVTKKGFCLYGNFCFQRLSGFVTVCLFKNNPQYECSKFVETICKIGGKTTDRVRGFSSVLLPIALRVFCSIESKELQCEHRIEEYEIGICIQSTLIGIKQLLRQHCGISVGHVVKHKCV